MRVLNFSDVSGCELILLSSSLAISMAQGLSNEEIAVLAAFFTTLGDNLALLAL